MTPTIGQVVEFLREHGQPAMAFAVEHLERQQRSDRECLHSTIDAFNALREKHEQPQWRPPDHVARGRQSD